MPVMDRPQTADFIELEDKYGAHNYHPLDVVIERAEGVWVYDVDGNRYLDCLASYSAVNQGHCHPKILKAMVEQAHKVTLTSRAFRNDQLPLLYQQLHELTGYDMALPMNSGAEAVETAIKAARKWGYKVKGIPECKAEIIVCSNNFHGRTVTVISFSSDEQYRDGFGPFTPGFKIIPFGDAAALRDAITPNTCAFLVEPIQGEAGIMIPPAGFLKEAAEICRANNVLFIADEIQSGLGRTGKLFAFEHEGIRPDMVIVGKALAGGFYPVSAVLSSKEVLGVFQSRRSRQHLRRQSAGMRRSPRRSTGADRREADRALRRARRLLPRQAEDAAQPAPARGPRQGLMDRHRVGRPGASLLRSPEEARHPVQGNARPRHPHCPAADDHPGGDRLGLRSH